MSVKNVEQATHAYLSASKCSIKPMIEYCFSYITSQLRPENVHIVYHKAIESDDSRLKFQCETMIINRCCEVLQCKEFLESSLCFVQRVLQLDYLNVKNELFIFNSLVKWAKAECERKKLQATTPNLRRIMAPLLPHVRFLSMTSSEFEAGSTATRIFTSQEETSISWSIGFPGSRVIPLPFWCNAITRERWYVDRQIYFCCYYGRISKRKHVCSRVIQCSVKVNRSVLLVGANFYVQSSTVAPEGVKIIVSCEELVTGTGQSSRYNRRTNTVTVFLSEPIQLNVSQLYRVKACFTHSLLLCGSRIKRRVDNEECNRVFDVNPELEEKGTVWEMHPHFRGFLYRISV